MGHFGIEKLSFGQGQTFQAQNYALMAAGPQVGACVIKGCYCACLKWVNTLVLMDHQYE